MLTDRIMHQRLCPETSLLVIIDIQERLLPAILQQQQVLFNARRLLEAASVLGVPVVVTEQYPQGLGKTVKELLPLIPAGTAVLPKKSNSCRLFPQVLPCYPKNHLAFTTTKVSEQK